jgi:hypothetical protein
MRLVSFVCVVLLPVCAREGSADEGSPGDRRPRACQRTTAGVEEVAPSEPRDVVVGTMTRRLVPLWLSITLVWLALAFSWVVHTQTAQDAARSLFTEVQQAFRGDH